MSASRKAGPEIFADLDPRGPLTPTSTHQSTSTERVCYICNLPADAERIAQAVRSHWEVENRLHWCLDSIR